MTFAGWYLSERTFSIHSILTPRREAFYWLTFLLTFALRTAPGDLLDEQHAVRYLKSPLIFPAASRTGWDNMITDRLATGPKKASLT